MQQEIQQCIEEYYNSNYNQVIDLKAEMFVMIDNGYTVRQGIVGAYNNKCKAIEIYVPNEYAHYMADLTLPVKFINGIFVIDAKD